MWTLQRCASTRCWRGGRAREAKPMSVLTPWKTSIETISNIQFLIYTKSFPLQYKAGSVWIYAVLQLETHLMNSSSLWMGKVGMHQTHFLYSTLFKTLNGNWTCITIVLFQSTNDSKHFPILVTLTHSQKHSYSDGGGCHAGANI